MATGQGHSQLEESMGTIEASLIAMDRHRISWLSSCVYSLSFYQSLFLSFIHFHSFSDSLIYSLFIGTSYTPLWMHSRLL